MTTTKTIALKEAVISYRKTDILPEYMMFGNKINNSTISAQLLRPYYGVNIDLREAFIVLMLNRANKPICIYVASIGGINGTVADPKTIFQSAILCGASGMIISHNHPSGNTNPSEADKRITKQFSEGGKLLDIAVLDHLIITEEDFYSFADNGVI